MLILIGIFVVVRCTQDLRASTNKITLAKTSEMGLYQIDTRLLHLIPATKAYFEVCRAPDPRNE